MSEKALSNIKRKINIRSAARNKTIVAIQDLETKSLDGELTKPENTELKNLRKKLDNQNKGIAAVESELVVELKNSAPSNEPKLGLGIPKATEIVEETLPEIKEELVRVEPTLTQIDTVNVPEEDKTEVIVDKPEISDTIVEVEKTTVDDSIVMEPFTEWVKSDGMRFMQQGMSILTLVSKMLHHFRCVDGPRTYLTKFKRDDDHIETLERAYIELKQKQNK